MHALWPVTQVLCTYQNNNEAVEVPTQLLLEQKEYTQLSAEKLYKEVKTL